MLYPADRDEESGEMLWDIRGGSLFRLGSNLLQRIAGLQHRKTALEIQLLQLRIAAEMGDPIPVFVEMESVIEELPAWGNLFVLGDPGSGKSAFAFYVGQRFAEMGLRCFCHGVPNWCADAMGFRTLEKLGDAPAGSIIIVDESGLGLGMRHRERRRLLKALLAITRHGDVRFVFVAQNAALIDPVAWRSKGILCVKRMDPMVSRFDREELGPELEYCVRFQASRPFPKEMVLMRTELGWIVTKNPLPENWSDRISRCHAVRWHS